VRGEGFDFGEVVRGDERGGVSSGVDESSHKFFANDGVEPLKGSSRMMSSGRNASALAMALSCACRREMSEFAVEGSSNWWTKRDSRPTSTWDKTDEDILERSRRASRAELLISET